MTFLIDGYNLMHHIGLLYGPGGNVRLETARRRLLDQIRRQHASASRTVTVVFDARHAQVRGDDEMEVDGLRVVFAKHDTADDWIIDRIRLAPTPSQITVVTNDHRVQLAARRRGCVVANCEVYLDTREAKAPPARPPQSDKPDRVDAAETERWLREFGFEE